MNESGSMLLWMFVHFFFFYKLGLNLEKFSFIWQNQNGMWFETDGVLARPPAM